MVRLVTAIPLSDFHGDGPDCWGMPDYANNTMYLERGNGHGDPFTYRLFDSEYPDNDGTAVEEKFNNPDMDCALLAVEHMIFVLIEGYKKW